MKRIALIDNATLTACQRLLGDAKVANLYSIDGDIVATEGLIQALLFCDEVITLDDYKEEFRTQRHKRFDFIRFVAKSEVQYSASMQTAREATENIAFRVRGHEIDNKAFAEFFDQLKAHIVFNWKEASSTFYLTLNLLTDASGVGVEKYSVMHAMLTTQLFGESCPVGSALVFPLSDKRGRSLESTMASRGLSISEQVQRFGAALNWLALKSAFYVQIAKLHGFELVLHPIRHAFAAQMLKQTHDLSTGAYDAVTALLRDGISHTVTEIVKTSEPVMSAMYLPMWCACLATRTRDPLEFFTECMHLRQEGPFVEARQVLSELEELNQERHGDFVVRVNQLNASLQKTSAALLQRYGVGGTQRVPISPFLNLMTKSHTGLSVPPGIKIPLPLNLSGVTARYGFRGILRSVTDDLVTVERLGRLHDVITSRVRKDSEAKHPVATETSRSLGRDLGWKKWL